MKEITIDVLHDAANRLLFDMSDEECVLLSGEIKGLCEQMRIIGETEGLEAYEPMTFPFPCETTFLREDIPTEPLTQNEALANAGSKQDGQIKLPKVVI